jgi:hypothetical protein
MGVHAVWPAVWVGHCSSPAGQLVQVPELQVCCGPQTVPHAPQFTGSDEVSVQASPALPPSAGARTLQRPRGEAQEGAQTPAVQAAAPPAGTGQAIPQAPQLALSVATSTQVPLQLV